MTTKFTNKYGTLQLELISDVKSIGSLGRVKDIDDDSVFSIDEAEKVALITGNEGIQIAFDVLNNRCGVIVHETGSTGAWAKSVKMEFADSVNPTKELAKSVNRGRLVM
jgi:hypothetical protein